MTQLFSWYSHILLPWLCAWWLIHLQIYRLLNAWKYCQCKHIWTYLGCINHPEIKTTRIYIPCNMHVIHLFPASWTTQLLQLLSASFSDITLNNWDTDVLSHRRPTMSQVFVQAEVAAIYPVPVSVTTIMRGHRARGDPIGNCSSQPEDSKQILARSFVDAVALIPGCSRPCSSTATATAELLEWSIATQQRLLPVLVLLAGQKGRN